MITAILLSLVGVLVVYWYIKSLFKHRYWSSRGIKTPPYLPVIGHFHRMASTKEGRWIFDDEVYRNYGGSHLCGLYEFTKPTLMVGDPELLKSIFVKDFDHFTDRRCFQSPNKKDESVNTMLSNINGEQWKKLRSIMSPTFTSGKMRNMFPLVCQMADVLVSFSLKEASRKPTVDMKLNFGRYTMDTIASCAFGIECNSFLNEDAIFTKKANAFFEFGFDRIIKFMFNQVMPSLFKLLNIRLNPQELSFFDEVAKETLAARRKGEKRGDFLDLLLDAQTLEKTTSSDRVLDDTVIVGQSVLFIIAGYDTTASTLAFSSYLLAKHPEKQERLRQEIQNIIREHGEINYQAIMEAMFLDSCIMETLRMYPPAVVTERVCTKDYVIPGTNIILKPGDLVQAPVWSIHHDEKYWPDPHAFNPDRFMPENRANIKNYTHMPFGVGPRNCIAMRFALMETKVALAKLILAADFKLPPGRELKLSTGIGVLKAVDGVHLLLTPRREE